MTDRRFRSFLPGDIDAVLAVFDSNVPEYFAAGEREDLAASLADPDGPFFVLETGDGIIGFGGFERGESYNRCTLTWGMVHRDHHQRGHGRALLAHRAAAAWEATRGDTRWLTVDTTPPVAPFFEHCGFERVAEWPQGYRAGFDMVELRIALDAGTAARLSRPSPERGNQ